MNYCHKNIEIISNICVKESDSAERYRIDSVENSKIEPMDQTKCSLSKLDRILEFKDEGYSTIMVTDGKENLDNHHSSVNIKIF